MFEVRKNKILRRQLNNLRIKSKPIQKSTSIADYLREFSLITTLHGIVYLGESKRPFFERILWLSIMSLVLYFCGAEIIVLFNNWKSNTMVLTLDLNYNVWNIPFPAITFCSDVQLQHFDYNLFMDEVSKSEFKDSINTVCNDYYSVNKNVSLKSIKPQIWKKIIQKFAVTCGQRIITMYWLDDEIQSSCQYFQPIFTQYGLCYSLNMMPFQLLFHSKYYETLSFPNHTLADIITKKKETSWSPDKGFSKNAIPFDTPWRVTGDTNNDAVRLVFNLRNIEGDNYCPHTMSGVVLILHNPSDTPSGYHPSAYLASNHGLSISLSVLHRPTSQSLAKWSPEMRHCFYENEKRLKFFKLYTFRNCISECQANLTFRKCGCAAFYQPRDSEVPICGSQNYRCYKSSFNSEDLRVLNSSDKDCGCLPDCSGYNYDYDVVKLYRNWSTSFSNVARRNALLPFNELLGNIGGLLGLFLGCSLISFFEIIYFFLIRLYFDKRKLKKDIESINVSHVSLK
ncbi:pickpocket protein 28-like isoform X2 [Daktulosphaira vitifoliae]|uniref:pickpocket protein 28-like isoform X2 n=1 Tax=Daktulosphaira vitifoliae TaxID=58002 RepID=UPI0021AA073E|nr:pickpocket protein 28-like isoform X2 [Daktulosphaira vitifoliae]